LARFAIWGGLVLVVALRYFDVHPILLDESVKTEPTKEVAARTGGEVLIVADTGGIARSAEAGQFSRVDWSLAWVNTVEQELGPHAWVEAAQLRGLDLAQYKVVIVTASAGQIEDKDLLGHLKAYVQGGGVLVLERPQGGLRDQFSADGRGGERQPQAITRVLNLAEPYAQQLKAMPLRTSYIGSSGPAPGAVTYLAMDGAPVIYRAPLERGQVITVELNWGLQLTAMQQGQPEEDFSVLNRYPEQLAPALESSDLVMDQRLLDNPVPYADLLEKFFVHGVLNDARPVVGLWPFPNAKQGALLMTHDEEQMGNKSAWMAQWERERGARSTYFVIPNELFTKVGASTLRDAGADVGLHWNRPQDGQGLFEPVGVWKVNPFMRARGLEQQAKELNGVLPKAAKAAINRNHYLLWGEDYTGVFRELAAAGFVMDSTYGPDKACRGYLFGTGLPFWAMDTNGFLMPIMEHPFISAEDLGGVGAEWVYARFLESQRGYHQAINVLFHPNVYLWKPSLELFDLWTSVYDIAEDTQHQSMTMRELYRFWKERRGATLSSQVRVAVEVVPAPTPEKPEKPPAKPKPEEAAEAPELPGPPEDPAEVVEEPVEEVPKDLLQKPGQEKPTLGPPLLVQVEVQTQGDGHALSLPEKMGERRLQGVRRGRPEDGPAQSADAVVLGTSDVVGYRVRLVPLEKGFNTVTATYQ
jgi:hypothetical protein